MGKFGRLTVLLVATSALTILTPLRMAVACTCDTLPPGNPVDLAGRHIAAYDQAFIGTVDRIGDPIQVREGPDAGTHVPFVFDIEVPLAGQVSGRVIILQGSRAEPNRLATDCSFGFVAGGRYIVEARTHSDGVYFTDGCTFTQPYGAQPAHEARARTEPVAAESDEGPGLVGLAIVAGLLGVAGVVVLLTTFRQRAPGRPPAAPDDSGPPPTS